jgi:hypothetical protein
MSQPEDLKKFQVETKDFATLYAVSGAESLETKIHAIKVFLIAYTKPHGYKNLGALHTITSHNGVSLQRLLEQGAVKLTVEFSTASPVEGQKENYAISKLFEDLKPS